MVSTVAAGEGVERPPLLAAERVSKVFPVGQAGPLGGPEAYLPAVSEVSLAIQAGETLGLVGESGCGKSTLARLLTLVYAPDSGHIALDGQRVDGLHGRRLKQFRRRVQMVFQDPFSSLNPRLPISAILEEPLKIHRLGGRGERLERCRELLAAVGLGDDLLERYPHQFSGGQRQRIAIARALALGPDLIVADEAVSALDVSVQSQILNLLADLKQQLNLAYLFISHDLAVIDHLADRVAVMYLGRIVELAGRAELFSAPAHPYTEALMISVPAIQAGGKRRSGVVIGDVPSALNPPPGCPYHPRCERAADLCRRERPVLRPLARPTAHAVACHFPSDGNTGTGNDADTNTRAGAGPSSATSSAASSATRHPAGLVAGAVAGATGGSGAAAGRAP